MNANELPIVTLYVDGACFPNPGSGAAGIVLICGQHARALGKFLGADSTNNTAEILAAVHGLQMLTKPCQVEVISDSQYLINTMTRGWSRKKNNTLWALLDKACESHTVTWTWVRGHNGNRFNELAHTCAEKALRDGRDFDKGYFAA